MSGDERGGNVVFKAQGMFEMISWASKATRKSLESVTDGWGNLRGARDVSEWSGRSEIDACIVFGAIRLMISLQLE